MPVSIRTTINDETLSLVTNEAASVCVSQHLSTGETDITTTITFSSSADLSVVVTGNLDVTVIGSVANDIFDFSGATGNYKLQTQMGNDRIIDGFGDDVFDGGGGLDAFVFNVQNSHLINAEGGRNETDKIAGYVVADDRIEIVNGIVVSAVQTTLDQVTLTLSEGDRIVVEGTGITVAGILSDIVFV
jgi:Ca2+-binding RTX toxin-like protein